MLHPERHRSQRRACGQSQWLVVLCKTLSFSFPSRFILALSLTPITVLFVWQRVVLSIYPQGLYSICLGTCGYLSPYFFQLCKRNKIRFQEWV